MDAQVRLVHSDMQPPLAGKEQSIPSPSTGYATPLGDDPKLDAVFAQHSFNSHDPSLLEEVKELGLLPGDWPKMLCDGEVLTALLLSTSFSEKYKGRKMQPGDVAEITLPAPGNKTRTCRPKLLQRAGYKEAVAFIWLGDDQYPQPTFYVAFSPLRFRSQFLKILCAGDVQDGLDLNNEPKTASWKADDGGTGSASVNVPVSAYVYHKLRKLWGQHGLWDALSSLYNTHKPHRVIFAGISHGAALAQAAALQFQMTIKQAQVYALTWNAYRWTDSIGRAIVERELGDRILPFALSRRGAEPQATRYWDTATTMPRRYSPMPNMLLIDADSGEILEHVDAEKPSNYGAVFLMRFFELHFAKAAISATKKATMTWCGCIVSDQDISQDEDFSSPLKLRIQEKILRSSQKFAKAQKAARKRSTERIRSISTIELPRLSHKDMFRLPRGQDQRQSLPWWIRRCLPCLSAQ